MDVYDPWKVDNPGEVPMDIDGAKIQLMDKAVLARFIVKPRDTIIELGLDPDDEQVAKTFEPFLQQMNKA
eukprot:gene38363-biopygen25497